MKSISKIIPIIGLSRKAGLPPGSLVHVGTDSNRTIKTSLIQYDQDEVIEKENISVNDCLDNLSKNKNNWVRVDGVHNTEIIQKIGNQLNIHPLTLEDIVNTQHLPKLEINDNQFFLTLKHIYYKDEIPYINHISIVFSKNWLITFEDIPTSLFSPIMERIKNAKGIVRKSGIDYLFTILADIIIDHYFSPAEILNEKIQHLEEDIFEKTRDDQLTKIQAVKKEVVLLRKNIFPLKEAIKTLNESEKISKETKQYTRDIYDHIIHLCETIDTFREQMISIKDLYMNNVSFNMNKVMQLLTIVATIFIPLTFIAGIYGMNFQYMPELTWKYSYFILLGIMTVLAGFLIIIFKKRKWF